MQDCIASASAELAGIYLLEEEATEDVLFIALGGGGNKSWLPTPVALN